MKNKWNFLLLILGLGLLQVTIFDFFRFFYVRPNLLLISVVIATLTFDLRSAVIFSAFAGMLMDVFASGAFGLNILLFSLWSFLIFKISRIVPLDEDLLRIGVVFILVLVHDILTGLVLISLGKVISFGIILRTTIFDSILTTLVSTLVFRLRKVRLFLI